MRSRHLILAAVALVFTACDSDSTGPELDAGPERGGVVGDDGGSVETSDGAVKLTFPAGAVSAETEITVEPAQDAPEDPDLVAGTTYDFGPDGTTFAEPVAIVLRFDPAQLPAGVEAGSLALHKAEGDAWRSVGESSVDTDANTVTATLTSFSVYGLLSLGEATTAEAHAGDEQTDAVGQPVDVAPAVLVLNQRGDPLPNVNVDFAVTLGGGSVSGAAVATDASGIATVESWTLGAEGSQNLTATVEGLDPVVFTATAVAACDYTAPYSLGQTVEGVLGAPDCVDGAGRYADYYGLDLDAQAALALSMTTDDFAPIIGVYAEDGTYLVAQYSSSRGFTRALLAPGSYRVGARRMDTDSTTIAPDEPAPYSMSVAETTHTAESCDIANTVFVTPGVTAAGTMTTGHCQDSYSDDPEQRYAQYQIAMRAGFTYTMTLTADTTAAISLWGADGQHKDIAGTSQPGTVQLIYTAAQDGFHGVPVLGHAGVGWELQFEVSETLVDRCAQSTPYVVGATNQGILSDQSCVDGSGRYTEYYDFVVEEQLNVALNLTSGEFDPFISAFDSNDRQVVTQYTASPGFTRAIFAPGTYRLAARSLGEGIGGWYDMWLEEDDHYVDVCEVSAHVFVTPGVLAQGYITNGDCLDELAPEPDLYWESYAVRLVAGETITATLSAASHARLSVWAGGENIAFVQGDAEGPTNVSVEITAAIDGWHRFDPIAYDGTEYSLSFSEVASTGGTAPAQGSGPLASSGTGPLE
ncbi:MAG: hypothetical protein WD995_02475 [Gemmatimonadota bacterium]